MEVEGIVGGGEKGICDMLFCFLLVRRDRLKGTNKGGKKGRGNYFAFSVYLSRIHNKELQLT